MSRMGDWNQVGLMCFAIFVVAFLLPGCNPKELPIINAGINKLNEAQEREIDETIRKSDALKELDHLCRSIVESGDFRLVSRSISTHGPPKLFFYYYSDVDFDSADGDFGRRLGAAGWRTVENRSMNPTAAFRKDDQVIVIQYGGIGSNANYGITCEKRDL
ncbi:MAG TPA: hypothetical protein VJV05_09405 [Pyrinomonadaceae bacterium]|nr:hypothetical protein [Pyrinomonadaceae bacterium]